MADLPDPSTLTDEELDALLETGQLPESKDDDKPDDAEDEDKSKEDEDDTEDEDKADDKADDEDEEDDDKTDEPKGDDDEDESKPKPPVEDKKPSRREQARIRDLLEKYGPPEDDKPTEKPKATGIDYEEELDADPELIKKLEADRQAAADANYDRGLEQMNSVQFLTRLEIDAPRVEAKYPQLDKNSDDFKQEAANDVNLLYLHLAGYDPKTRAVKHPEVRYTEFVDTIFNIANDLADTKVEKQVKEVKRQAAQTGLRPDGSRAKATLDLNKTPEDMTDEELDEYLKTKGIPTR